MSHESVDSSPSRRPSSFLSLPRVRASPSPARHLFAHADQILCRLSGTVTSPDARISWQSVDDDDFKLDEYTLKPIAQDAPQIIDQDDDEPLEYSLAVTGDVFRWMVDYAPIDTFQKMLIKGVIFGRFSPDEKAELVERLQGLGYTVSRKPGQSCTSMFAEPLL